MKHLTDEQLSALLDDALPAKERAACDAHLAGCETCRARLAELSTLDASLGRALTHDPGEGYFADFAERVARRIATGPRQLDAAPRRLDAAPEAPKARKPWLFSPRGLTLAGSTAALLVTAGIAWMRFHTEQDVARALHEASPSPLRTEASRQGAPSDNDEARAPVPSPPAASAPSQSTAEEQVRSNAVAPPRDMARMREVRTLPNGEQVPVNRRQEAADAPPRPEASGSALAAPATGSAIAQMKRRSVAPAAEAGAPAPGAAAADAVTKDAAAKNVAAKDAAAKDGKAESQPPSQDARTTQTQSLKLAAPPAPPAPPAATFQKPSLAADTSRGQSFNEWGAAKSVARGGRPDELNVDISGFIPSCGKVRDSRGRVVVGAQVTAVHNGVRTARTGPDGAFCIDGLKAGDTLTVMHVGFDPHVVVMTPMTSLAITLEPVGTLGPNSTMLMGKQQSPPALSGAPRAYAGASAESMLAPPPDVYADQSFGVRQLVRDAREATSVARRERTAPSFENAAKRWATVARQVKGAPAYDASFQYVSALREAYQLEPTSERGGRLRSAFAACLAIIPADLPEHATVKHWQAEQNSPTYR